MRENFSIRISDDIEALIVAPEPVVALNLMGLSMLGDNAIDTSKSVFWVDGIMGSLACFFARLRIRRIPGRALLAEVANYIGAKGGGPSVIVLGDCFPTPQLTRMLGFAPVQIELPWFETSEDLKNISLKKISGGSIVFITIASPKQEILAEIIFEKKGAKCFCVGGALNMLEGIERRAPDFVSKVGLEWLYRLSHEPVRRLKRLLSSLPRGFMFLRHSKNIKRLT